MLTTTILFLDSLTTDFSGLFDKTLIAQGECCKWDFYFYLFILFGEGGGGGGLNSGEDKAPKKCTFRLTPDLKKVLYSPLQKHSDHKLKWAIPENIRTHRRTAFDWNSEGMGGFRSGISRGDRQECVP